MGVARGCRHGPGASSLCIILPPCGLKHRLLVQTLAYSLAELSSAYPTSGGLYYWAFMTAPPKYKKASTLSSVSRGAARNLCEDRSRAMWLPGL